MWKLIPRESSSNGRPQSPQDPAKELVGKSLMSGSISPGGGIACARRGEVLQPQGSAYRITKHVGDGSLGRT